MKKLLSNYPGYLHHTAFSSQAVNESLTEKLCVTQMSMEESKNEMVLKQRQMQEVTTELQKSNELTIQLTRVNTEAKKTWESQRAELEKIISQSDSKYKVQHTEFEVLVIRCHINAMMVFCGCLC